MSLGHYFIRFELISPNGAILAVRRRLDTRRPGRRRTTRRRAGAAPFADTPPGRCQPGIRWLRKSFRPPGRGSRTTCSRSGAADIAAPTFAGSSGPRRRASARTPDSTEHLEHALERLLSSAEEQNVECSHRQDHDVHRDGEGGGDALASCPGEDSSRAFLST